MKLLNVNELADKLGMNSRKAALKLNREEETFPTPIQLTPATYDGLRWQSDQVDAWIEAQFEEAGDGSQDRES